MDYDSEHLFDYAWEIGANQAKQDIQLNQPFCDHLPEKISNLLKNLPQSYIDCFEYGYWDGYWDAYETE
jgi:hypothetical protein